MISPVASTCFPQKDEHFYSHQIVRLATWLSLVSQMMTASGNLQPFTWSPSFCLQLRSSERGSKAEREEEEEYARRWRKM